MNTAHKKTSPINMKKSTVSKLKSSEIDREAYVINVIVSHWKLVQIAVKKVVLGWANKIKHLVLCLDLDPMSATVTKFTKFLVCKYRTLILQHAIAARRRVVK